MRAAAEHIDFSEKLWQKLQEDKDQYFPEQEIVGWFFAQPQIAMEITELFVKVHLRHFGGEKILMLMDPGEREDAFFRYDGGMMAKLSGYYIYYEKNSQMQTYMIERSQKEGGEASEKVEDRAVRNFRKIIDSKNPEEQGEEKTSVFSYAATVCLALAVLVAGVGFYRNQQEKTEVPGRLSRCFCFGGADDTCSNRTGAECIGFAKGGADAETGANTKTGTDAGSCAGNSGSRRKPCRKEKKSQ